MARTTNLADPRLQRLEELEAGYQIHPGRRPNGTGTTGLGKHDAKGWSRMLNQQTEYLNLIADLSKRARPDVQAAPYRERTVPGFGIAASAPMAGPQSPYATMGDPYQFYPPHVQALLRAIQGKGK